jgi:hypothetical protein
VKCKTPDPVALNQAALEHRKLGQLDVAARHLREAIAIEDRLVAADSPKRPHRRNNLALVLMRAGKLPEGRRLNAEAWRLKDGSHDLTSGRILFVRIALNLLEGDDARLYLGQLKTLLHRDSLDCTGDIAPIWDIPDVLTMLWTKLPAADADLLMHAAKALEDRLYVIALEALDAWRTAAPVPLEVGWPEGDSM